MNLDYYKGIYGRVGRALGGRPLPEVLKRTRAIVGPRLENLEGDAHDGMEALKNGRVPTHAQVAALQAVVRSTRPSIFSRSGTVGNLDKYSSPPFPEWRSFCDAIGPYLYTIGRIDRCTSANLPSSPVGTGFLIAKNVLITNKHVLTFLSEGTDLIGPHDGVVYFRQEYMALDEDPVPIKSVLDVHQVLDIAVLSLEDNGTLSGRPPLKWSLESPRLGTPVVAIGYPFPDTVRNPIFTAEIFGDKYGLKRLAPGEVIGKRSDSVFHDCSTLGGNSGSAVVDMRTRAVVGVHRDGFFLSQNEAVSGTSLKGFVKQYAEV